MLNAKQNGRARKAEDQVIARALQILEQRMRSRNRGRYFIDGTVAAEEYLRLRLTELDIEAFWAMYLDPAGAVIGFDEIARGTLSNVSVPLREVARGALRANADAVIVAHNHPGGLARFSAADRDLTDRLRKALSVVDVWLHDHFLVAAGAIVSLRESAGGRALFSRRAR